MIEEKDMLITLLDENGKEVEFDLVMTFDYEGRRYAAMFPTEEVEGVEEDEVVILEIVKTKEGERYLTIHNPILLDEVFAEFMDLWEEEEDEEEDGETEA